MKNEVVNCKEEILNNLFVKCSCGGEVIEFQHIKNHEEEPFCKIKYYGLLNNLEDDYATSYGTEFTMSVENMVRFCHSVYQMYLFFEEEESMDNIRTLEFNDEYEGSENIIRVYYCEKDSYMFIQCYYNDAAGNKVDMWEIGVLDRDNIVDFMVTLLKFAEDIIGDKQNVLLED